MVVTKSNVGSSNYPYIKEQFTAVFGNSSVVVKFLCVALSTGYFMTFSSALLHAFSVIPENVLPPNFWIWTYLTHSFLEKHIWIVIVDIVVVVLYGKLLEPLWGALEMLIFYLVVNLSVALLTTLTYFFIFLVVRNPTYLFETYIFGLAGYVAGFSVAVKQVMPDHVLINSAFGKLRNKHIPLLLLTAAWLARLVNGVEGPYPFMFGYGLIVSWVYLRFYQKHTNGNRGDMTENFTFASFFPQYLHPVVAVLANTVFSMLVKVKICKKPQRKYDVSAPTTITVSLPGTDPADAERRRQLALKALNERLSKVETASWPSVDDADTTPPTTPHTTSSKTSDSSEQTAISTADIPASKTSTTQ